MTAAIEMETLDGGIRRLCLNDTRRRNALSLDFISSLLSHIHSLRAGAEARILILAANGPVFSAGHDLKEITAARQSEDAGQDYFKELMARCAELMIALVRLPIPVIAEVGGVATAAGCQLVASCDLAIAGTSARFATPGVNIGLFCSTPMVALTRNVAPKHAMEMLLTGDFISAEKAEKIGLVNRVVEDEKLTEETLQLARQIAGKSARTLAIGKEAFYRQSTLDLDQAYEYCASVMVANLLGASSVEGISAFLDKRHPVWSEPA